MQVLNILTFLVLALVSYTSAQCPGRAPNPNCAGGINWGSGGRACRRTNVWSWDGRTRQCRRIVYTGCGGNQNRWCTRAECERACRR